MGLYGLVTSILRAAFKLLYLSNALLLGGVAIEALDLFLNGTEAWGALPPGDMEMALVFLTVLLFACLNAYMAWFAARHKKESGI